MVEGEVMIIVILRRGYNIRRLHPGLVKLTILCKT